MYVCHMFWGSHGETFSPNFQRLEQARSFDLNVGGAELNVAVGVTRLGMKSTWVSKLPKNGLGYLIRNRVSRSWS